MDTRESTVKRAEPRLCFVSTFSTLNCSTITTGSADLNGSSFREPFPKELPQSEMLCATSSRVGTTLVVETITLPDIATGAEFFSVGKSSCVAGAPYTLDPLRTFAGGGRSESPTSVVYGSSSSATAFLLIFEVADCRCRDRLAVLLTAAAVGGRSDVRS